MMDINTLASKVGGEIVGGRLVATVDDKKVYLSAIGDDGKPFLNELGLRISNELSAVAQPEPEPKAEPAPKRARRKPEPDQIELDLEV